MDAALRSIGTSVPRSPKGALLSLLFRRARVRLRGLGFHERNTADVPSQVIARIDTLWSVAAGFALTDIIRGADFQTRSMLLALDAGEPFRVARAVCAEAGFTAANGGPALARTTMLLDAADSIADKSGHPQAIAMARASRGLCAYLLGRFGDARAILDDAYVELRDRCTNVFWELNTARQYACLSLAYAGSMAELCRRVPEVLREALARGNLYAATSVRTSLTNLAWLAMDDPERAHDELVVGMREWSRQGFHLQHHWVLLSQGQIDLYTGASEAAYRRVRESWDALDRSLLLRVQIVRVEALHLRARAALALSMEKSGAERDALVAEAAKFAKKIDKEEMEWTRPIAALVHAAVARRRGDDAAAIAALDRAAKGFDAAQMALFAASARARLAELTNGEMADVDAWMRSENVQNPARMVAMMAPGF
jgi:hypothetical protein